MQAVFSEAQLL